MVGEEHKMSERLTRRGRLLQTVWLGLGISACGMCLTLRGPTLLDLQRLTGTSLAQISAVAFTGVSAGWILGGIVGGIVLDRYNQQIFMTVSAVGGGVFTALVAMVPNIVVLSLVNVASGAFIAAYDAGCLALCLQLWQDKAAPYMQTLDFLYALGCLASPLFVELLLQMSLRTYGTSISLTLHNTTVQGLVINYTEINSTDMSLAQNESNASLYATKISNDFAYNSSVSGIPSNQTCRASSTKQENQLFWCAFLVFGALTVATGIPFAINACRKFQTHKKKSLKANQQEKLPSEKKFVIKLLVLLAIYSFIYNAVEETCSGLMKAFAIKQLCWSESSGNKLLSVFWGVYTLARIIGIVEAIYLHPGTIVIVHGFAMTLSFYLLLFVNLYQPIMWIAAVTMGISIAPVFTARINWADRFVTVSGKVMGLIFSMEGIGSMIWTPIIGYLVDAYGPMCFVYLLCFFGTGQLVLFIVMHVIAMRHGSRFSTKNLNNADSEKAQELKQMTSTENKC